MELLVKRYKWSLHLDMRRMTGFYGLKAEFGMDASGPTRGHCGSHNVPGATLSSILEPGRATIEQVAHLGPSTRRKLYPVTS